MIAYDVANAGMEVSDELRCAYNIPDELQTRDEVAEYLFHEAARLDAKHSAAYYNMGIFYMDNRDCEKAKASFRKNLEYWPDDPDSTSLLQVIEKEGCFGGRLFYGGKDAEERQRIIDEYPEVAATWK